MTKEYVDEYLQTEYSVSDPSCLQEHEKYVAYERLKYKIIAQNLSPDEYTQAIINLAEHLEL